MEVNVDRAKGVVYPDTVDVHSCIQLCWVSTQFFMAGGQLAWNQSQVSFMNLSQAMRKGEINDNLTASWYLRPRVLGVGGGVPRIVVWLPYWPCNSRTSPNVAVKQ